MGLQNEAAIYFDNVSFSIEGTDILRNITGSIPKSKITTLVGPSGAGKTSLLKLCNGLATPTSGDLFIEGKPISDYDPITLRKNVGMALQSAPMIKGTVFDNLDLPRKLEGKNLTEEEAERFLENVGLEKEFLYHQSHDLVM